MRLDFDPFGVSLLFVFNLLGQNWIAAIEFLVIAAVVIGAAWEPRKRTVGSIVALLRIRYSTFFDAVWVLVVAAFFLLFWRRSEFWPLLAVLAEIAGVIYLAREVYVAQEFEEYRRGTEAIRPFIEIEMLADQGKYDEYVYTYYKLDGRTRNEADADMSVAKLFGTLEQQVNKLRAQARVAFERPRGPLAVETFLYRRRRLIRGVVLVSIGLAGHGLHLLMQP